MAITQITNDVQGKTADYAVRVQQLEKENQELSKNLRDLLEMQDGPCSEQTILKEHIRVLEERVQELVSQNFKLVQRLTEAEEIKLQEELRHEDFLNEQNGLSPVDSHARQLKTEQPGEVKKMERAASATQIQKPRNLAPNSAKALPAQMSKMKKPTKFEDTASDRYGDGAGAKAFRSQKKQSPYGKSGILRTTHQSIVS